MARVSKGKLRHLYELYNVKFVIELREFNEAANRWHKQFAAVAAKWPVLKQPTIVHPIRKVIDGGFYSGSRQLSQEADLDICISVSKQEHSDAYRHIVVGKHRAPNALGIVYSDHAIDSTLLALGIDQFKGTPLCVTSH